MSATYQAAGVNIAAGTEAVNRIKTDVQDTFSKHVIGGLGGFGAMFDLKGALAGYDHPVLVQSIDGVGTKMIVARMANFFDNLGEDILSACANDLLVLGAKSLTLLDYIACDTLEPDTIKLIVGSMCRACKKHGVSLVGGEMAEMPDTYLNGEYDVVGIVSGVLDKDKAITGANITPGDKVYGLASSGLHTNGFSLARKLFFKDTDTNINDALPGSDMTVGEALLQAHINYAPHVHGVLDAGIDIKGMAHITGGGLVENLPRILPKDCGINIKLGSWPALPVFDVMRKLGNLTDVEAHRTFNMGIGWVFVADESQADAMRAELAKHGAALFEIGDVVAGEHKVQLV
jgi:phosphoribosylformylglycinamidine cyclo-ligase